MGRLPTGYEVALHRRLSCNYKWLPCMVGPPGHSVLFNSCWRRAPESRKQVPQSRCWSLQGYANLKLSDRRLSGATASPHGRQASQIPIPVCRVWDRQGDLGRHREGQSLYQLHTNVPQTPHNLQNPAKPRPRPSPPTSSGRSAPPCRLLALLGPAVGPSGQPQMPCHYISKGKSQNQCLLATAVAILSLEPSQP